MAYRNVVLATSEIYHIVNRSLEGLKLFDNKFAYQRFIDLLNFYYRIPPVRFSYFNRANKETKIKIDEAMINAKKQVDIIAFCLMPNHFHLILRQHRKNGISNFVSKVENGYARFFNIKNNRKGAIFESAFYARRIENNEQLIHVSRYVHLNPLVAFLTEKENLTEYSWFSFKDYLDKKIHSFVEPDIVLASFKTSEKYFDFVMNQADYQRKLNKIKHLISKENYRIS